MPGKTLAEIVSSPLKGYRDITTHFLSFEHHDENWVLRGSLLCTHLVSTPVLGEVEILVALFDQ